MSSLMEMYYATKEKHKQASENLSLKARQKRLLDRLCKYYEDNYKDVFGNYTLPFPFRDNEQLIFYIPEFALKVLEQISDSDIFTAAEAVLCGIKYCPNCMAVVQPNSNICPKCSTELPKDSIPLREINSMIVTEETRQLLKTIATKQIKVDGKLKNLEPVEEKTPEEIITSLSNIVPKCPDCGMKIVPTTASYCWNCGEKLEKKYPKYGDCIIVSLPIDEVVEMALNKIAMEEMKDIEEFDFIERAFIEEFCNTLVENEMANAQLCKKMGAMLSKFKDYEEAICLYEKAMEIDSTLDLYPQIKRLERKIEKQLY